MAPGKTESVEELQQESATVQKSKLNDRPSYVPAASKPIPIIKPQPIPLAHRCRFTYLRLKPLQTKPTKVVPTPSDFPKISCPTKKAYCHCYQ